MQARFKAASCTHINDHWSTRQRHRVQQPIVAPACLCEIGSATCTCNLPLRTPVSEQNCRRQLVAGASPLTTKPSSASALEGARSGGRTLALPNRISLAAPGRSSGCFRESTYSGLVCNAPLVSCLACFVLSFVGQASHSVSLSLSSAREKRGSDLPPLSSGHRGVSRVQLP